MSDNNKFFKNSKLVKMSLLALLASSAASPAWGVLTNRSNDGFGGGATLSNGAGLDQFGVENVKFTNSLLTISDLVTVDEDATIIALCALDESTITVKSGKTVASGSHVGSVDAVVNYFLEDGSTLKLTGTGVTATDAGAAKNANGDVVGFNGGNKVFSNTYTGFGSVTLGVGSVISVESAPPTDLTDPINPTVFGATNLEVVNVTSSTFLIKNTGVTVNNDKLVLTDSIWATFKTIGINSNSVAEFNSTPTVDNKLFLQQEDGNKIILTNTGTLSLIFNNGVNNIQVANGFLGATSDSVTPEDLNGNIYLNSSSVATNVGNYTLTSKAPGTAVPVIGQSSTVRATGLRLESSDNRPIVVDGQVFAKNLQSLGGPLTFTQEVNVGAGGSTKLNAKTLIQLNVTSNLGTTTFVGNPVQSIAVNTNNGTNTLTGNFIGSTTAGNISAITYSGTNPGALVPAIAGTPVTQDVTSIENNSNQVIKLAAGNYNGTDLNFVNAGGGTFLLADGFISTGNINVAQALGPLALGNITAQGNAKIAGNIGHGAGGGEGINVLTLANDANKKFEVGGTLINTNSTVFGTNGGTLKILNVTAPAVDIFGTMTLGSTNTAKIDASAMTEGQTLGLHSIIGSDVIAMQSIDMSGGANLNLSGGNINSGVIMNDATIITLENNKYILTTTNNENKGKVQIVAGRTPTLAPGTNLGSQDFPLEEFSFLGNDEITLNQNVNITAVAINNANAGEGEFVFDGVLPGPVTVIRGPVGTAVKPLNAVILQNNAKATFADPVFFAGNTTIDDTSTLQISQNYTANMITGTPFGVAGTGTIELINTTPITIDLADEANDEISAINFSGSADVKFTNSVFPDSINFNGVATAGKKLILAANEGFTEIIVRSTAGNPVVNGVPTAPIIVLSVEGDEIEAGQRVGDKNNIVALALNGDITFDVNEPKVAYVGIYPVNPGEGTVNLNGIAAAGGQVFGLGIAGQKLKAVNVVENTTNYKDTRVNNLNVNDGKEYFGTGVIDSNIILGTAAIGNGLDSVLFFDQDTNFLPTSTITTLSDGNGTAEFRGNVNLINIAGPGSALKELLFTGANGNIGIGGNIYSNSIQFNSNDLNITNNASLNGVTTITGNINLNNYNAILSEGDSTWDAAEPKLSTTFSNNGDAIVLGTITIANGATLTIANPVSVLAITDNARLRDGTYTLINVAGTLTGDFIEQVESNQAFASYTVKRADNSNNIVITRVSDADAVVTDDIASVGASKIISDQNIAAFTNPANTGDAATTLADIGNIDSSADRAQAEIALIAEEDTTNEVARSTSTETMNVLMADRLGAINAFAPSSGDEDNRRYGAWAKPFYAQADQKMITAVAGYKSRTAGALLGVDTTINDSLILGAALGLTDTKIKHKNYKAGDKTTLKGVSLSLYGSHQFVNNFFVQGIVTYAYNKVKDSANRYVSASGGSSVAQVAHSKFNNHTYGGEVLVGYDARPREEILVTPMAGFRYLKSKDGSYKETGTTSQNKNVSSSSSDKWELVAGARVIGLTLEANGVAILPELHGYVNHKIGGKTDRIRSRLDGQVDAFTGLADETAKTLYNLGIAVSAIPGNKMEYGVGYDLYLAKKYIGHQGTLKLRINL